MEVDYKFHLNSLKSLGFRRGERKVLNSFKSLGLGGGGRYITPSTPSNPLDLGGEGGRYSGRYGPKLST